MVLKTGNSSGWVFLDNIRHINYVKITNDKNEHEGYKITLYLKDNTQTEIIDMKVDGLESYILNDEGKTIDKLYYSTKQ